MSVEEAGTGERGRECESEIYTYISFSLRCSLFYCYFICTFLSLEPMCQRKIFIFMLCILMNNKDLCDLIDLSISLSLCLSVCLRAARSDDRTALRQGSHRPEAGTHLGNLHGRLRHLADAAVCWHGDASLLHLGAHRGRHLSPAEKERLGQRELHFVRPVFTFQLRSAHSYTTARTLPPSLGASLSGTFHQGRMS